MAAALLSALILPAQTAGTGVITGRIFSPATSEYLRHAQVRIQETGQSVTSDNAGEFRLSPVPVGRATLVVTYTGYRAATETLDVAPGAIVTRDFNLISSLQQAPVAGDTIKLDAFVVSSEREGNACSSKESSPTRSRAVGTIH